MNRSSFHCHLGKKKQNPGFSRSNISVAMGLARSIFLAIVCFIDLNIYAKFQCRSSRASFFSHGNLIKMPSVKYVCEAILGHHISRRINWIFIVRY